jgi:hypothetical protein
VDRGKNQSEEKEIFLGPFFDKKNSVKLRKMDFNWEKAEVSFNISPPLRVNVVTVFGVGVKFSVRRS